MSGLSDLHDYDLTDAERLALCAELERLNRSLSSSPVGGFTPPTPGLPAGDGDLSTECTA